MSEFTNTFVSTSSLHSWKKKKIVNCQIRSIFKPIPHLQYCRQLMRLTFHKLYCCYSNPSMTHDWWFQGTIVPNHQICLHKQEIFLLSSFDMEMVLVYLHSKHTKLHKTANEKINPMGWFKQRYSLIPHWFDDRHARRLKILSNIKILASAMADGNLILQDQIAQSVFNIFFFYFKVKVMKVLISWKENQNFLNEVLDWFLICIVQPLRYEPLNDSTDVVLLF
jgi:hypothetical protein